jgi:site-specific DNA-methyltransferase (adenine-specific)
LIIFIGGLNKLKIMKITEKITITNECNMELMKRYPDNYFDLAIVDPPYGISYARGKNGWGVNDNRPTLENVKWDKETPSLEYFNELIRVSKEQIIWGGNYFTDKLPVSKCWIIWNKINNTENKSVFADGELAWTSFKKVVKMFTLRTMGFISDTKDNNRIHPTQKPTELYKWILDNYAKQGDKILDTHLGSGSIAIAAHDYGFELTACELDVDYYNKAIERIKNHISQIKLEL